MKIDIADPILALLGGAPQIPHDHWSRDEIRYVRHTHQAGIEKHKYDDGKTHYVLVQPANPQAAAFADAVVNVLAARIQLESKQKSDDWRVDSAEAEEIYNRAADKLWDVLQGKFETP